MQTELALQAHGSAERMPSTVASQARSAPTLHCPHDKSSLPPWPTELRTAAHDHAGRSLCRGSRLHARRGKAEVLK